MSGAAAQEPSARLDESPGIQRSPRLAVATGAPIGLLGGLIGLGGAEFRLPVLKGLFRYPTHQAVALNLAVSLVTLVAAAAIRLSVLPAARLAPLLPVMLAIIAGSMSGAWIGASYASRLSVETLERMILVLLVGIGLALASEAFVSFASSGLPFGAAVRLPVAVVLGVGIGVVSSLLGVAGGELIIPTLVFVFGADIKNRRHRELAHRSPDGGGGHPALRATRRLRRAPRALDAGGAHGRGLGGRGVARRGALAVRAGTGAEARPRDYPHRLGGEDLPARTTTPSLKAATGLRDGVTWWRAGVAGAAGAAAMRDLVSVLSQSS